MLTQGNSLMDISLPESVLVAMIKRNRKYFIPRGNTILESGDIMLVMADNEEVLNETRSQLGLW